MSLRRSPVLLLAALLGCAPVPAPEAPVRGLAIPVRDPTPRPPDDDDPREAPPDADPERAFALPASARVQLASGVELITAPLKGSPVVELRLAIRGAGSASEGASAGLASVALRLCLEGGAGRVAPREVTERLGALGALPSREVRPEAAYLSLSVPQKQLNEALSLLLSALREPRLDAADLARVKRLERSLRAGRSSAPWAASALALRELVQGPPQDPGPADIDRITLAEVKAFHKLRFGPAALSIVATGDVDPAALKASLEQATAPWKAPVAAPPAPALRPPLARHRLLVVDVPGRPSAELLAMAPGPARLAEGWPAALLLAEVLGGGPASRLAASPPGSPPLVHPRLELRDEGAFSLFQAHLAVDPARVAPAFGALVDALRKTSEAPSDAELLGARRRAVAAAAQALASPGLLADDLARLAALRAPDGTPQQLLEQLRAVEAPAVAKAARDHLAGGLLVVVLGDAAQIASPLTRWGEVTVVALDKNFEKIRVLPETPPPPEKK